MALDDGDLLFANQPARDLLGAHGTPGTQPTVFAHNNALREMLEALRATGFVDHAPIEITSATGSRVRFHCDAVRTEVAGHSSAVIVLQPWNGAPSEATVAASIDAAPGLWRMAFQNAGIGIILLDRDGSFVDANRSWQEMFGYTIEELRLLYSTHIAPAQHLCEPGLNFNAPGHRDIERHRTQKRYEHKSGKSFWGDFSLSTLRDGSGAPAYFVGFLLDISAHQRTLERLLESHEQLTVQAAEHRKLQEQLSELAVRDPLTGLFNRRYMEETLERELARSARDGKPLSLIIMDIDHFKQLNDSHGHQAGDQVLRELATLLSTLMRKADVTCRYGGEEFVAILPGAPVAVATHRAETLRRAFENVSVEYGGETIRSTLSAGIAEFPQHGTNGKELLFQADCALYLAKRSGRNRVSTVL